MKILYISQYFHPEVGAPTNRALVNVKLFTKKGHDITVLAEMPNHPKGVIFEEYKKKIFVSEKVYGLEVKRVWVFTSQKKNFFTRVGMYLSFSITGSIYTLFNWRKYDVVYVTSPPLFVGIIGLVVKFFHPKTKFVFEVRDLWPDAAIEMGELNSSLLKKISYSLEHSIYKKANLIVSVTNSFKYKMITKGVNIDNIIIVRNGANLSLKRTSSVEKRLLEFKKNNNFTAIYAGNIGLAQNILTIIKAAELLENKNVSFIIVGIGPEKTKLEEYAKEKNLNNIYFEGEVIFSKINQYLSIADCGIIPLKKIPVFESTIPSKIFDYMAVELPILLGVLGESKQIVKESEAGICYEPDNSEDLAKKILFLKNNPDKLNIMRSKGRKFVENNFNREKLAEKIELELIKLVEERK